MPAEASKTMLRRFSLYGFLKNQRYFEPFLLLAFLDKGLSFTQIGLLIAFREICVNVMEVPSGALADLYGRRGSMIFSFVAYIVSFVLFGLAVDFWLLSGAMVFFAAGEAFRTGTHKAMIFAWLREQGREHERTRVYGYTRSWSKIGSAVSVLAAAVMVLVSANYTAIFYVTIVPYLLGVVNFLGYPASLDGRSGDTPSVGRVVSHLREAIGEAIRRRPLRRLVLESMGFEGMFKASKDYLQPVLAAAAATLTATWIELPQLGAAQKTALLVGPVYILLHFLSATASRNAYRVVERKQGEEHAARWLWGMCLALFAALLPSLAFSIYPLIIVGFVLLHVLQDLWRPVLISRFDTHGTESQGATLLSVENQAKSLGTMLLAPLLGAAVDLSSGLGAVGSFWPLAAAGIVIAFGFRVTARQESPIKS